MATVKVGVLGSGIVGEVLADGFLRHGYQVMRGSRETAKLNPWLSKAGSNASIGSFADAAAYGDIVVLAVKGNVAEQVVTLCAKSLTGKIVIDPTNPIADVAPENGILKFFTEMNSSLMERLQKQAPKAHFVKAFSCVGSGHMVQPDFGGTKPTMFICGNEATAKAKVESILEQFGWETEDMGPAAAARAIEPLCMLYCIPGFMKNQWHHAFKLLKSSK